MRERAVLCSPGVALKESVGRTLPSRGKRILLKCNCQRTAQVFVNLLNSNKNQTQTRRTHTLQALISSHTHEGAFCNPSHMHRSCNHSPATSIVQTANYQAGTERVPRGGENAQIFMLGFFNLNLLDFAGSQRAKRKLLQEEHSMQHYNPWHALG